LRRHVPNFGKKMATVLGGSLTHRSKKCRNGSARKGTPMGKKNTKADLRYTEKPKTKKRSPRVASTAVGAGQEREMVEDEGRRQN